MIRLIQAQVIGLRTLRSTYAVLAGIVAAVLVMVFADLGTNAGSAYVDPPALREPVLIAVGVIITIIVCVFAATAVAGDYRYKTIDHRLLATPHRSRWLLAVLATYTMFALVVATLAMGLALAIALPLVASHDLSLGLTAAAVVAPVVAVASFAVIGVAIGTSCRSQTAAILVIVGWFPAEKLLGLALGDSAAYLPYGLVNQVLGLEGATVGRGTAFACLGCYAVAAGLLAATVLTRRDVN